MFKRASGDEIPMQCAVRVLRRLYLIGRRADFPLGLKPKFQVATRGAAT
jgi:hypothetical protein